MGAKTRLLALTVAALGAAALLGACASGSEAPADSHGKSPALEQYLDTLGDYAVNIELIQDRSYEMIQGHLVDKSPRPSAPGQSEYRRLVARYREQGLEGLSTEDRHLLLSVAQVAFEAYPEAVRYSATAEDAAKAHKGEAVLEEVYRHPPAAPPLAARRVHGRAMMWAWLKDPLWDPDAPNESVGFVGEGSGESQSVTSTEWEKRDTGWTCTTGESQLVVFALAEGARLTILHDYVFGDFLGSDEVDGRAAYRFHSLNQTTGRDITYWLDAETLWLRQYEYEEDGIRYTVKLEAVNEDITIEPPDVDVPCVEEQPE